MFEDTSVCNARKSELTLYLEEQKLDYESFQEMDMDVIKYWKDKEKKYPDLSVMARHVMYLVFQLLQYRNQHLVLVVVLLPSIEVVSIMKMSTLLLLQEIGCIDLSNLIQMKMNFLRKLCQMLIQM